MRTFFIAPSTWPSRSPATMARRIFWPVSPTTSDMTLANWMFICVSAFCMCWTWRAWLLSSISRWRYNAAQHADLLGRTKRPAEQAVGHELLQPLAVQHVGLAPGDVLDVARIDQQHGEAARLQQLEQGIQYTPVDSIATVSTPQASSQSARALRSTVKLGNSRTGSSSRSGGTATKWDALPMSMPAALGWVIVSAARDLPGLRLTLRLRWAMACSIIRCGMWRRIGYVVLLTLSNGISTRRLTTVEPIHQCR